MRRLGGLALALLLLPALALAQAPRRPQPFVPAATTQPFDCEEVALDMSGCVDPLAPPGATPALEFCPAACDDPTDSATCGMKPLPELDGLGRNASITNQGILRQAVVTGGPYTGVTIALVSLNASADVVFIQARDQLCKAPPLPPAPPKPKPPTPPPPAPAPTPPPAGNGPGIYLGGGPVWYGPNPGFR